MSERNTRVHAAVNASASIRWVRLALALTLTALALLAPRIVSAQDWRTQTSSRRVGNEDMLKVDIKYAAGELKLGSATAGTLYRTNMRYDAEVFRPKVNYADKSLRIGIDGNNVKGRNLKKGLLDLQLTPDVPLDIDIEFGAAEADLQLGGLRVRNLEISTGASSTKLNISSPNKETCRSFDLQVGAAKFEATGLGNLGCERIKVEGGVGEVTLDFTGAWRTDMNAEIDLGLGSLTLRLPRGVGVRVEKDGLLASFDSQGLVKRGNMYYSENWERASRKLTFNIDAALGSIRVVWVD